MGTAELDMYSTPPASLGGTQSPGTQDPAVVHQGPEPNVIDDDTYAEYLVEPIEGDFNAYVPQNLSSYATKAARFLSSVSFDVNNCSQLSQYAIIWNL